MDDDTNILIQKVKLGEYCHEIIPRICSGVPRVVGLSGPRPDYGKIWERTQTVDPLPGVFRSFSIFLPASGFFWEIPRRNEKCHPE
jgi:hypothetical protein